MLRRRPVGGQVSNSYVPALWARHVRTSSTCPGEQPRENVDHSSLVSARRHAQRAPRLSAQRRAFWASQTA